MKIFYLLLFLIVTDLNILGSDITSQTKSQLKRKKKRLQKEIKYLQDRMLYQEANAQEPAQLYGSLAELEETNEKIKKLSRK